MLNPSFPLESGGDRFAMGLKVFTGAVYEAWREAGDLMDNSLGIFERITPEHGVKFSYNRKADLDDAQDFTPGVDEMVGQNLVFDEKVLTPDKYLVSSVVIGMDQILANHFDALMGYGSRAARKLQQKLQRRALITNALNARSAALTKDGKVVHGGGNRVTRTGGSVATAYPTSATGAQNFIDDLNDLAQLLDEDNVPEEGRFIKWTPYMRRVLQNAGQEVFNHNFVRTNDIQNRQIVKLAGFQILPTSNTTSKTNGTMPDTNITTEPTKFQGNFTPQASDGTPVCQVFCVGDGGQKPLAMIEEDPLTVDTEFTKARKAVRMYVTAKISIDSAEEYCSGSVEVIT